MSNIRVFKINSVPLQEVAHPVLGEEYCMEDGSIIKVSSLFKESHNIKSYYIIQPSQLNEGSSLMDLIKEGDESYTNKLIKLFWKLTKNNRGRSTPYEDNKDTDK